MTYFTGNIDLQTYLASVMAGPVVLNRGITQVYSSPSINSTVKVIVEDYANQQWLCFVKAPIPLIEGLFQVCPTDSISWGWVHYIPWYIQGILKTEPTHCLELEYSISMERAHELFGGDWKKM